MPDHSLVRLRSWLLEEVESLLTTQTEVTLAWSADLLTALWSEVALSQLILEAELILPSASFRRFLSFAIQNYPEESLEGLHAAFHTANEPNWPIYVAITPPKIPATAPAGVERLQCIHWNCSGLSEELQIEWFAWLRLQPQVKLFVLVETHWSFTSEYRSHGWHLIHSAKEGGKGGGIMIGTREDMTKAEDIKWRVMIPGRLVHLRSVVGKQQMDVIGIYQTAVSHVSGEKQQELARQRNKLWHTMDNLLAGLPFRSSVVVLGDFNATLSPLSEVAGSGIVPGPRAPWLVQERSDIMQILRRHRLVVLNTWLRPTHTFHHPNGKSQIDYILIRKQLADQQARRCTVIAPPIAAWRSSGHKPLLASFRLNWKPWKASISNPKTTLVAVPHIHNILAATVPSLEHLRSAVKQQLEVPTVKPRYPALSDVDPQIHTIWQEQQRRQAAVNPQAADAQEQMEASAKQARQELRKLARQRKRQRMLDTLEEAQLAFQAGDIRLHFQMIRKLAPKTYRRKLSLKSASGDLLSNAEECELLASYATDLFDDSEFVLPPLLPVSSDMFSTEQWQRAFEQQKPHKAVPMGDASIQAWRTSSEVLAEGLSRIAQATLCSAQPELPQEWAEVQLAWLPKPGRAPTSPGSLRTIGLMGADVKSFLTIIKHHVNPVVQTALRHVPQYAYRQLASTGDALLRATLHCTQVRQTLAGYQDDHTSRVLGAPERELLGGLMVSIDLSKAFDKLRYEEMYLSLQEAQVPELGMTVNFAKSIAVLALKGAKVRQMLAKHTKWWNGARCLVLRENEHDIYIPIQDSMPYLGAVLSYHSFELQTAQHRIQQANSNFAQLRDVLRTNGALSRARKLDVYRMCVWTSLTYGIASVGATSASCRSLQSTAAMHLRKLLRIYKKGYSNEAVLRQADLALIPHLCQRAAQQAKSLEMDVHRAPVVRRHEDERSRQVQLQLQDLERDGLHQHLVPIPAQDDAHVSCPVCGLEFVNASGLHQHLHQKHPEVAKASSIDFVREQHSLFGLPYCRFCRHRMKSWQTLTKHVTQGMCLRLKTAIGQGQTIQELLARIEASRLGIHLYLLTRFAAFNSVSLARNAAMHATQCSVMFQVLSIRRLRTQSVDWTLVQGSKRADVKEAGKKPAYKSFQSPMAAALKQGAKSLGATSTLAISSSSTTQAPPIPAHKSSVEPLSASRTLVPTTGASKGTIQAYFQRRGTDNQCDSDPMQAPFTCHLRLVNPQALCYVNAGITAILHACQVSHTGVAELEFLTKVLALSTQRRQEVLLPRLSRFRALTPDWDFHSGQQDTAEYMHYLFQAVTTLQITWDSRCTENGEHRIRAQGSNPIPMNISDLPEGRCALQEVVCGWHCADGVTAMNYAYPIVCIQVNRYIEGGKCHKIIDLPAQVLLPVFDDVSAVTWHKYDIRSSLRVVIIVLFSRSGAYGVSQMTGVPVLSSLCMLDMGKTFMWWCVDFVLRNHMPRPLLFALRPGLLAPPRHPVLPSSSAVSLTPTGQRSLAPLPMAQDCPPLDLHPTRLETLTQKTVPEARSRSARKQAKAVEETGELVAEAGKEGDTAEVLEWTEEEWDKWASKSTKEMSLAEEVKHLRQCLFALQRMVLRAEDFMSCIRAELSWVMFLRLDMKATVVPALFQQQKKWREIKAQTPEALTGPMRMSLVVQLFKELGARLANFHEQEELLQTVQNLGWYDHSNRSWFYVKWDADNERLTPDTTKEPIGFEKLSAVFASLQQLAAIPNTVMRFHPSRPMEETMGGKNLTFVLQLCILGESSKQFRDHLSHLSLLMGLAVTQLVGMGLRPERANRSTLANMIQSQLQELTDREL
ncbi:unnamed protein product [Symbiodinium sp. CCMP2592]|nr:unnamed protein product [Symbiodinium sp. CCMP2592]